MEVFLFPLLCLAAAAVTFPLSRRMARLRHAPRRGLRLLAAGAALVLLAACGAPKPPAPPPEDPGEEVTDPARIEAVWNEYMYYAIVGLQQDFTDPAQLDLWDMLSMVTDQFFSTHDVASLQPLEQQYLEGEETFGQLYVWPFDQVGEYLKKYFDYEVPSQELYRQFESMNSYGPYPAREGVDGLLLPVYAADRYTGVKPMSSRPWGDYIEWMRERADGTLLVALSSNFYDTDLVNTRRIYTLAPNPDGESYHFAACQYTYVDQQLAGLSGTYQELSQLDESIEMQQGGWALLYESDDSFYFGNNFLHHPEAPDQRFLDLYRLDKTTGAVRGHLQQPLIQDDWGTTAPIRATGEGFLLREWDQAYHWDLDLKLVNTTPTPQRLRDRMQYEYDPETNRVQRFFGGYDVTLDGAAWYYSCQDGLFVYDSATGQETLLVEPEYGTGRLMEGAIIVPQGLQLMEDETRLLYLTYGYEGLAGMYCRDLTTGQVYEMPISGYGGFGGTQYGAGHSVLDAYSQPLTLELVHFSFRDLATRRYAAPLPQWTSPEQYPSYDPVVATGRSYAAWAVSLGGLGGGDQQNFRLQRVRLDGPDASGKLPQAEELDFQMDLTHAYPTVVGVTDGGKVLLWYSVNPAEQGLLLVG